MLPHLLSRGIGSSTSSNGLLNYAFVVLIAAVFTGPGFAGVAISASVDSEDSSLCFKPADWVGKYPSKSGDHASGRFFDLPCVHRKLKAILSSADFNLVVNRLTVDAPIQMMGNYLLVARCEAHNCPSSHAMVIIDTEKRNYFVGLYRRSASVSITKWYATDEDPYYLPTEIRESFLRKHEPRP